MSPTRSPPPTTSPLISFYSSPATSLAGYTLSQILTWDFQHLEQAHDYIQIIFPLPEHSGVSWNAPIVTRDVFEAFRSRPELRENMRRAFGKMCWFYGFEYTSSSGEGGGDVTNKPTVTVTITPHTSLPAFNLHRNNWDMPFSHNHLRITRIIRSLRVLGLEAEALAFYSAVNTTSRRANNQSREFWRRAAKRSLNLRPDLELGGLEEEDEAGDGAEGVLVGGKRWLWEWVVEEKRSEKEEREERGKREKAKVEKGEVGGYEKDAVKGGGEKVDAHRGGEETGNESEWEGIKDDDEH